ncbi:peptide synthase [Pseudomonas aeruginosa]|nr:peptide synthase [Pseudomonas aeruginosa]
MTLDELLQGLQRQNLALREQEHTPLFELQRWAGFGGEAVFDNLLVFENYPVDEVLERSSAGGVRFGAVAMHEQTNYPLALALGGGDSLSLQFSYDRELFPGRYDRAPGSPPDDSAGGIRRTSAATSGRSADAREGGA